MVVGNARLPETLRKAGVAGAKAVPITHGLKVRSGFGKAVEADPKDFSSHFNIGLSFTFLRRDTDAIAALVRQRVGGKVPDVQADDLQQLLVPQTGARFFAQRAEAGLRDYRVELLEESADEAARVIRAYQALLRSEPSSRC